MFDVVAVGHLCVDSIYLPHKPEPFIGLGGSVAYASLVARRLGANVSIISKVGKNFPETYLTQLAQEGIDLSSVIKVEDAQTTSFELKYNSDLADRSLRLKSKAPPIMVEDLPKSMKAKTLHIGPIAGEINYETIRQLRKCSGLVSLDPQGLVRNFDKNGKVTCGLLVEKQVLEHIDVYKSSLKEIENVTGTSTLNSAIKSVHDYGAKIVIVTLGTVGAMLSFENSVYKIPAYKPENVVDPTGAGDAFIGAFLAEHVKGKDVLWCACVGSAAASLVVEVVGSDFHGDKKEIYRRAQTLYEKGIKQ